MSFIYALTYVLDVLCRFLKTNKLIRLFVNKIYKTVAVLPSDYQIKLG